MPCSALWRSGRSSVISITLSQIESVLLEKDMIFAILLFTLVQDLEKVLNRDPVIRVLPKDAIPAIDSPAFEAAETAVNFMRDEEIVIGVTDGKHAKAYSTWLLDKNEIVNDVIGSTPIAVTW
jgi:Protein of unknown function (DUF3179)